MPGRRAAWLLAVLAALAAVAPWLAPHDPAQAFRGYRHAPPMPPRLSEGLRVYPVVLEDRLLERFVEDRSRTLPLPWSAASSEPVFLLGTDAGSRDVFSRLLAGTRLSVGLALLSVVGATLLGATLGAFAGLRGGWIDELVMRAGDLILILPALYLVLVLRAVLPIVLSTGLVFALMAAIFTVVGWPIVARGVRGIVSRERDREYVQAARSLGAGTSRLLVRHLLPACAGHVAVQASLLLPGFILAEAALSYVGLGFPDPEPTWGTMLRAAADINELSRFPWTLAPAGAIFAVTLATNIVLRVPGVAGPGRSTDAEPNR